MKNIIIGFLIFILIYFFIGLKFSISVFQYDEIRLLQLFLVLISFVYIVFFKYIKFNNNIFILFLVIILFLISSKDFKVFQLQETLSLISLFVIIITLKEQKMDDNFNILFILICFSIFPCFFIFLSMFNLFLNHQWYDWQLNGGSIRIYDSVIVPLFFIAMYLKYNDYKYINKIYPSIIFLYTLAWCFDGARSALISIIIPLSVSIFFKEYRSLTLKTLFYIMTALIFYKLTYLIYNSIFIEDKTLNLIRTSSSSRAEMWFFVYEHWKESPVLGVGGGYLASIQYKSGHHIHNFYLRLIFEWGVIGYLLLMWIICYVVSFFKNINVNLFLKLGVLAISIDAMFSGNLVYSASQLSCVLFLGLAFGEYENKKIANKESFSLVNNQYDKLSKILLIFWFLLYLYVLFYYFGQDLFCWQCTSQFGREAPNFWYYGGAEHLRKQ